MGMRSISALAATAAIALTLGTAPAQAATVLGVNWNADCGKSTCFNDKGVFSQTFAKGDFSGPVTVAQLLMDRSVLGSFDTATFRLSFQLNGEEVGAWGKYNMTTVEGQTLSFFGENFVWNPEDGDLVLVLELVPPWMSQAGGLFAALDSGDVFGEPGGDGETFEPPPQRGPGEGEPPVNAPGAIPEPGTWALMIAGFGLAGVAIRRRRAVFATQPSR
jgi:hypothetical protein